MALTKKDKDKANRTVRREEHREVAPHIRSKPHRNKKKYDQTDRRNNSLINPGGDQG